MNRHPLAALAVSLLASSTLSADAPQTVAHWTFGANGLTDITGNNTITLENHGVTFTNGAALFDGNSYFVTATPVSLGATSKAFTIECWVRFDANDNYGYLFAPSDASEKGAFVVYQYQGNFLGQLRVVAPSTWQQETIALSGTGYTMYPHHVAYVVDASKSGADQVKLYLDGTPIPNSSLNKSGDFSSGFGSRALFIGAHGNNGSPNNGFKGQIDDIRITDGALEPSQFLKFPTICDAMTPANPAFAYYPFGADGSRDVSGNGNNLEWKDWQSSSPSYLDGTMSLNGSCSLQSPGNFPFSQFTRSGLTFEYFFRTTSTPEESKILMETSGDYNANIGAFVMSLEDNGSKVFCALRTDDGRNAEVSTGTPAANDGRWHHVAMVYDPTKTGEDLVVSYMDGVKLPTSGSYTQSNLWMIRDNSFFIGGRANYKFWVTAEFDDVRIMPYALSPSEFLKAPSVNAPVAHWKFGSETPLVDVTGNGNDLVNNGVTFADGAAVFNGSGATLQTASSLDLSAYRRATIECRYQVDTASQFGEFFATENANASNVGSFTVYKYQNQFFSQFSVVSGTWQQDGIWNASPYATAGWHHLAFVLDVTKSNSDECKLYVDGVEMGEPNHLSTGAAQSALFNQVFHIGGNCAYSSSISTTFDGKMSEIIVTPLALAPGSFKLSRNPDAPGTIAYWDFSGSGWADKSGNGHALTATGMSRKKGAAQFADVGATLATTSALDLSTCRSFTVECFAKADSAAADPGLFSFGNGTAAGSFSASIAATGGAASRYVPYASALNSDAAAVGGADGGWHHYALVIDGDAVGADQARLYVDGVQASSLAMASGGDAPGLSSTFSIGAGFSGLIDDVRLTAGALAPAQFMQPADRTEIPDAFVIVIR